MRLDQLIKAFDALDGNEMLLAADAINENSEVAKDLVAEQLAKGIKSDGEPANFTYSPWTIAIKRTRTGLAAVTDHLTNYDTGESYRELYFKVNGNEVEAGTNTDKEEAISDRMDGQAFMLSPEQQSIFIKDFVQNSYNKAVRYFLAANQ